MKKLLLLLFWGVCIFIVPAQGQNNSIKQRVAILETIDKESVVSSGVKLLIRNSLASAITNMPGYEAYNRVNIASILGEHEFQRSGLVSDAQIKRLGEMTGASEILVSEVALIDEGHICISAQILNVESAKLENSGLVQTGMSADEIQKGCQTLSRQLLGIHTGKTINL